MIRPLHPSTELGTARPPWRPPEQLHWPPTAIVLQGGGPGVASSGRATLPTPLGHRPLEIHGADRGHPLRALGGSGPHPQGHTT